MKSCNHPFPSSKRITLNEEEDIFICGDCGSTVGYIRCIKKKNSEFV
jgi:hypothetical protein